MAITATIDAIALSMVIEALKAPSVSMLVGMLGIAVILTCRR